LFFINLFDTIFALKNNITITNIIAIIGFYRKFEFTGGFRKLQQQILLNFFLVLEIYIYIYIFGF